MKKLINVKKINTEFYLENWKKAGKYALEHVGRKNFWKRIRFAACLLESSE